MVLLAIFVAVASAAPSTSPPVPVYSVDELARMATEPGHVETLESSESDPVGQAGLWGMVGDFVVAHSCDVAFAALSDIEKFPERMEKVKHVKVIERTPRSLLVDYTEAGMGLEANSTVLWLFAEDRRRITSRNVGPDDPKSWTEQRFRELGPGYCGVTFSAFVDVSWIPNFILNFAASSALEETAAVFRRTIAMSTAPPKVERGGDER